MNVVKNDTRELTDVTPINFQAEEIIFYEIKITGNFAGDIEDMVKGNFYFVGEHTKKVLLNDTVDVFDMGGNFYVVEYSDKSLRDSDIELLKQRFQEDGKFTKELEEKRQVPTFDGYFDYDGKYYTIVNGLNKLTDEINPENGVYKGVIVNPGRYFKVEDETKETSGKINNIL